MRRHLPRLLLTGALLSPVTLYALGLGEIRLNSALNQPFDAEIELIAPTVDELASLKVGLASNELFSRYGLDRPSYLSNFDFSISRSRDGRATIKVRSNRSVTEPFVTLLVEASWARGRLLREYTVLLDPPVFMPSQSQAQAQPPVSTPQSGARTEGRIERPQPETQPEPQPEPPARRRDRDRNRAAHAGAGRRCDACTSRRRVHGRAQRHAVEHRESCESGIAVGRQSHDDCAVPQQPRGVQRQHQRFARGQRPPSAGRRGDRSDHGRRGRVRSCAAGR